MISGRNEAAFLAGHGKSLLIAEQLALNWVQSLSNNRLSLEKPRLSRAVSHSGIWDQLTLSEPVCVRSYLWIPKLIL